MSEEIKMYYDPEYMRIVDESVPKSQYDWFASHEWWHESYEEFLVENFLNVDGTRIKVGR